MILLTEKLLAVYVIVDSTIQISCHRRILYVLLGRCAQVSYSLVDDWPPNKAVSTPYATASIDDLIERCRHCISRLLPNQATATTTANDIIVVNNPSHLFMPWPTIWISRHSSRGILKLGIIGTANS